MNKTLIKHILLLVGGLFAISCSLDEMYTPDSSQSTHLKFIPRPTTFVGHNVTTRSSSALTEMEQKVVSAYFLAFNNKGERFFFDDLTEKLQNNTIPSNIVRSDIRTTKITVCYLANVPYEFASSIKTIEDLNNPLSITYTDPNTIGAIGVPLLSCSTHGIEEACIPMSAIDTVALPTQTTTFPMELKRLFAKMDVEISLNLAGEDEHKNKFFTLVDYSVINLPNKVKLLDQFDTMTVENIKEAVMSPNNWGAADMAQTFTTDRLFDGDATFGQNQGVSFTFYAPEHFVNSVTPTTGLPDDYDSEAEEKKVEKQKYKPLFVGQGQYPTLMRFKGLYVEVEAGEELVKTLTYDIYLGRDNFQDFCIFRNYKYNNKISITGTQNFKDGGWMGVDHRVDLETKGFLVGFKRATLLDAHYEVRPMRVRFPIRPAAGTVSVEILKEDKTPATADEMPWIRLERPASSERTSSSATHYTSGKRKYFTTDLVSETLKNNVRIEYDPHDGKEGDLEGRIPIWVYVDEYAVAADDNAENKNRKAIIRVTFTPDEITENSGVVSQSFIVQQRAMYPISYDSRTYNIEYFEEYLYNFDGEENYGEEGGEYVGEKDGIKWGLDDQQLSYRYKAMYVNSSESSIPGFDGIIQDLIESVVSRKSPYYDFYLERDIPESIYNPKTENTDIITEDDKQDVVIRNHNGYLYNFEIITSQGINDGTPSNMQLNDETLTAIEYCYKKNKSATGKNEAIYVEKKSWNSITYNTENCKWFLPAIDEMEDIILGGKDNPFFYDIFSNSWYWSCQPSFNRYFLYYYATYTILWTHTENRVGEYYLEDTANARATKLKTEANGTLSFESSDSDGYSGLYSVFYNGFSRNTTVEDNDSPIELYEYTYSSRRWNKGSLLYTFPYEEDHDGVILRENRNRVRCIYNPDPPTTITVDRDGIITKIDGESYNL